MFGEHFGGRYRGQVRKGRPHGYGQLGRLPVDKQNMRSVVRSDMQGSAEVRIRPANEGNLMIIYRPWQRQVHDTFWSPLPVSGLRNRPLGQLASSENFCCIISGRYGARSARFGIKDAVSFRQTSRSFRRLLPRPNQLGFHFENFGIRFIVDRSVRPPTK